MRTVAVLLTCHNRVNKTMDCLAHLFDQSACKYMAIAVYLVDDGSTDGTGEAVKRRYPDANVIMGDGTLFWNRGMHRAFGEALKTGFDYYVWLNDDTYLFPDALDTMLNTHDELCEKGSKSGIVVASTRDPESGEFSYGGFRQVSSLLNPISFRYLEPQDHAMRCETMCGNCVLISRGVADAVGNIDPEYRHRWGDVDYGLRARERNLEIWVAPGYLGECDRNPNEDVWRNYSLPLRRRIAELHSLKGLGGKDWFRFVRRHAGIIWPFVWIRPYLRIIYDTFR